ncbi:MAG TPA: ABC transporter ATP-binding protein [Acetivibrio sp.]|nr:ABC transporter ATP-binding protein [Clostridium sp.]HOQ36868.1 ABC transporter ATP-binding protein [Acetivibrio sp.]HPT89962.1 ABC transporter ATP-binding protein [Acetivibrio sp.]HQA58692.1 ABC transporter ATP-binding protein [Acetivibrio sp.]
MLIIKDVSKSYNKGAVKAVDGLNLHVRNGEIFGFLGPNGAGKTTTIKMIVGLLNQDSGSITIKGFDNRKQSLEAKKRIGYVPDNPDIYDKLTGLEYLNFMADVYEVPLKERRERIDYYLDIFDLKKAATDIIKSYSHGMKQKIVLTGALVHDPELWILDEPLVGLDPKSAHILKDLMRKHCDKGNSVFFSTHVLEVAERLCDRIGIINRGKLIAIGTVDELKKGENAETLENIFLELTEK